MLEINKAFLRIFLVACFATTVSASWWDDFTNNLATDLTPLIALFGEQATKQFLSESTTVLDNFLFTMAPLGILTGVVSAIRVCGGPSLRAFIGRAQEGGGVAEAELCSSTSRDVCELYHNGAIVRVFGRPKILEIVYDPTLEKKDDDENRDTFGINISREYFQRVIQSDKRWEEKGERKSQLDAEGGPFSTTNTSDNFAPNPNLSLNIGIVKRSTFIYIGAAIIGFLAQSSVLLLSAIVTYKLHWKKNENPIDSWAFPFLFTGTICVCFGMFLCATLVNDSTKERVFERKDGTNGQKKSPDPILYVVQPGNQVVGDQTFDPFLFSKTTDDYMTSWKAPSSSDSRFGPQQGSKSSQKNQISFKNIKKPSAEISVLIATFITALGFTLQFVGLRAMHSVMSLLQLAVTILMSIIRALLRTQRLSLEGNVLRDRPDEVSGHELDWLALQIGKDANDPRLFWSITAKIPTPNSQPVSKENKAWKYRSRLAELTGQSANTKSSLSNAWGKDLVSGRLQAQQLRKAIEGSIAILLEHAKAKDNIAKSLNWNLNVAVGEYGELSNQTPTTDHQSITVMLKEKDSVWTVDHNLLEAIIGLWSWSIISDPRTEGETFGFKTSTAPDRPMYRVIAAGTENEVDKEWREIQYWIEGPNIPSSKFNKKPRFPNGPDANEAMGAQRVQPIMVNENNSSTQIPMSDPYQRLFGWHAIDICNRPTIAATSIQSKLIPTLCSQDIYQSFLCTIVAYFDLHEEKTTVTRKQKTLRLEHSVVTKLIDCFEASGLGSRQDASLVIIPALRNHSRLPRATEAIPTAYKAAEDLRKSNNFEEAEGVLRWALEVLSELDKPRDIAMIELGELYRYALFSKSWQTFGEQGISRMGWQITYSVPRSEVQATARYAEIDAINRYVELKRRPRASRTGQHVLDAILSNKREETLWSISQLEHGDLPIDKESGRAVLSFLSQKGWFELVRAALEIGSVVDSVDKQGRTPLSYAAEHGHVSVVSTLVEASALPITEDSSRRTPLSYAAGGGHVSVMESLLSDPRVNVYAKDMQNRSPLHWAAVNGHCEAISYLVGRGAQITARDIQKRSPLHWAAANGHHDAIICLVDHGASVYDMDNNEFTPLLAALLNARRSRFDRTQTADLLVRMKSKLDYAIQDKELWEWALENNQFVCAEYILENFPRNNLGVIVHIVTTSSSRYREDTHKGSAFPLPPDFQSGFRIRFFHNQFEEKEVTLEIMMRLVKGKFSMEIGRFNGGLQEWAIGSEERYKIIDMLLDGFQELDAVEKLLENAATNRSNGKKILSILFDRYEAQIQLTEDVVKSAAENIEEGREMIALLLDRWGDPIPITEDVVKSAAKNGSQGLEILKLLLDRRGDQVPITEDVVKSVAKNESQGLEILKLLLGRWGDQVPITEDVVKSVAKNWNHGLEMLQLLLGRWGHRVPIMKAMVDRFNSRV